MAYAGKGKASRQLTEAHWHDLARQCSRDNRPYFTLFFPEEDTAAAKLAALSEGVVCTAWGGVTGASRVILGFSPEWAVPKPEQFPLCCLTFRYRAANVLKHRDFLGALMACNLTRDTIGEILIEEQIAQVFVCKQVTAVILQEIHQIGRVGVTVTEDDPVCLGTEKIFSPMIGTVASLRADAITAFVTRLSREKAVQLIRQGRLTCRHVTVDSPAAQLQVGNVFSVRGYGKYLLAAVDGMTRKGRYHITIQKYQN